MKLALFGVSILLCLVFLQAKAGYLEDYGQESRYAFDFYVVHKQLFESAAEKSGFSSTFLFAIVAPELSQYNTVGDAAQTYMLKTLYVQGGKRYANFSIGYFSIKPSFAEYIENQVKKDKVLAREYPEFAVAMSEQQARAKRVIRLETVEWQLKYLQLLCIFCKKKYPTTQFMTPTEQLRFYASVFNIGFHQFYEINTICIKRQFPRFGLEKYSYADVAAEFFQKIAQQ